MELCEIDLQSMDSDEKIHDFFEEVFALPEYYGRNMDALFDVLTSLCEDVLFVCVMGDELPGCANRMLMVLEDAAELNPHIRIELS